MKPYSPTLLLFALANIYSIPYALAQKTEKRVVLLAPLEADAVNNMGSCRALLPPVAGTAYEADEGALIAGWMAAASTLPDVNFQVVGVGRLNEHLGALLDTLKAPHMLIGPFGIMAVQAAAEYAARHTITHLLPTAPSHKRIRRPYTLYLYPDKKTELAAMVQYMVNQYRNTEIIILHGNDEADQKVANEASAMIRAYADEHAAMPPVWKSVKAGSGELKIGASAKALLIVGNSKDSQDAIKREIQGFDGTIEAAALLTLLPSTAPVLFDRAKPGLIYPSRFRAVHDGLPQADELFKNAGVHHPGQAYAHMQEALYYLNLLRESDDFYAAALNRAPMEASYLSHIPSWGLLSESYTTGQIPLHFENKGVLLDYISSGWEQKPVREVIVVN